MTTVRYAGSVVVATLLLWAGAAEALINPRFTPIQLVKQSTLVVSVDVKQAGTPERYVLAVREVLKGKTDAKSFALDLSKARDEQNANALRKLAAAGKPALFFVGEYAGDGGVAESRGLLHLSGQWASCVGAQDGSWLFDAFDSGLQAVWAGGTDMLRRAVDYIIQDQDGEAYVPVTAGVSWSQGPAKVATLDGTIKGVRPVEVAGDRRLALFVARDKGDRLFVCDGKTRKFADVTTERGLQSKSLAYAWGNVAGQGRLDLVSYDGKACTLHAQQADGTFKSRPLDLGKALDGGCVSLVALDIGAKDRAGVLVNGNALPVLVALDAEGKAAVTPLAAPGIDLAKLGKAGACLVADLDGDSFADILSLREGGSILFRGEAPGKFKPGTACAVRGSADGSGVCLGDYDADGRLDVLAVGGMSRYLWVNEGNGVFAQRFNDVGEMVTHDSQTRASDCMTGDVNSDGRQDVLLASANAGPVVYFNRGFISFGHSHEIDIPEKGLLPEANNAKDGQQSACLADLDGDGAQDMTLALSAGEIWVFFRANEDNDARAAMAVLSPGGDCKGPVTVTGWMGTRCIGAWNVAAGVGQGWFCRSDAGPLTLKWRMPGGKEQSRDVLLDKSGITRVEVK